MKRKDPVIVTSNEDNYLYTYLINLLNQVKLVRGANELQFTLRNREKIRNYLVSKQIERLNYVEDSFFNNDGSLRVEYLGSLQTQLAK